MCGSGLRGEAAGANAGGEDGMTERNARADGPEGREEDAGTAVRIEVRVGCGGRGGCNAGRDYLIDSYSKHGFVGR